MPISSSWFGARWNRQRHVTSRTCTAPRRKSATAPTATGLTSAGLTKARSENPLIATRGVALWIAAVYHETLDSHRPGMEELHRQILRLMRQVKELSALERREAPSDWMAPRAAG